MSDARDLTTLQNYAYGRSDSLFKNYHKQVNKWVPKLRELATAFYNAKQNVDATLKKREANLQARRDLAFAALGLVCGSGLNWIGYALKKTSKFSPSAAQAAVREMFVGQLVDAAKFGTDQVIGKVKESLKVTVPSFSKNPKEFETEIKNKFDAQVKVVADYLTDKGESVFSDVKWFKKRFVVGRSFEEAKKAINNWIQNMEKTWLPTVKYYSHNPDFPPMIIMERILERTMWSQWIKTNVYVRKMAIRDEYISNNDTSHAIEDRLVYVGVMRSDNKSDRSLVQKSKQELNAGIAGVKKGSKAAWLTHENKTRTLANPGAWTSSKDTLKVVQWAKSFRPASIGNWSATSSR